MLGSEDRACLCPVYKINMFIPYRWLNRHCNRCLVIAEGSRVWQPWLFIRQLEVHIALLNFSGHSKAVEKIWSLPVHQDCSLNTWFWWWSLYSESAAEERVFMVDDLAINWSKHKFDDLQAYTKLVRLRWLLHCSDCGIPGGKILRKIPLGWYLLTFAVKYNTNRVW